MKEPTANVNDDSSSSNNTDNNRNNGNNNETSGVGRGHMYFPNAHVYQQGQERFAQMPAEQQPAPIIMPPVQEGGGYGATLELNPSQQQQQHQFHYGNPDYHNPFIADGQQHPLLQKSSSSSKCCWCCTKCFSSFASWWSENLYRSFCFGAIDGMLTGASIAAAFAGMAKNGFIFVNTSAGTTTNSIIPPTDTLLQWCIIVIFTIASCTSDGICMALGHIWSTHILVNAQAEERRQEKVQFENQRSESKGKLIDMLLAKGMLKIDAMSIADTLEGYPDIFISALIGGDTTGHALGDLNEHHLVHGTSTSGIMIQSTHHTHDSTGVLGIAGAGGGGDDDHHGGDEYAYPGTVQPHHHHPQQHSPHTGQSPRAFGRFTNWSYGKFDERHHDDDDPESMTVMYEMKECRKEGFIMMISFSFFAIVPSMVHLWVVAILPEDTVTVSAPSMVFTINSVIMMILGIWKSQFFDSNWFGFGLEAVLVLVVSVGAAYGIGFGLSSILPKITLTLETP